MKDVVKLYELEDNPKSFERVDNLVIKSRDNTIQFGEICYTDIQISGKFSKGLFKELSVVVSSLDQERVLISRLLLKYISDLFMDGLRQSTIFSRIRLIMSFLQYLSVNKIDFNIEPDSIKAALINYSEYLLHKVKIYDKKLNMGLTANTAHNYQNWVLSFCAYLLNTESLKLLDHNYIITSNSYQSVETQPLTNEDTATEFNQYTSIFRRFSSIVLEHEVFPLTFDVNKDIYWITPNGWIRHKDSDQVTKLGAFNFNRGQHYSILELNLLNRYKNRKRRQGAVIASKKSIDKVNTPYSWSRISIALYACKAYFMHFLFLTGENDNTASSILFNKDYIIENSELNFKSIKWRSNGQTVKYNIQNEFINDFKIYLRLRDYLLKYYNSEYKELFLDILNKKLVAAPTSGKVSSSIRSSFSYMFSKNTFIATSKTIRVTKGIWIRSNHGSFLSSYILQHSQKTSNSSYTGSNFETSSEELTNYFNTLTTQLLVSPGIEQSTPSGNCVEPAKPQAVPKIASTSFFTIDCTDQKSCVFCSKYRIHADERDIRKLLSMKYLIIQSGHLSSSIKHFHDVYKLILARIDDLLCQIKEIGEEQAQLIIEINKQVFDQEILSDYWYRKLELLDELGVL
jgi:hypothetical protein